MRVGASILLIAVGAILTWAVTVDSTPVGGVTVEWNTVGVILMIVGALGLVWSLIVMSMANDRDRDVLVREEHDRIIDPR
ncbi:MAG: hypothetical protein JWO69_388 [Thermoleophilia bacterium]|jgi:hypothetical protein|nr:hypothetical protein [Thermoleophilia bacterium]